MGLAHTLSEMQKKAATRGGKCLSAAYNNTLTPLRWRCRHGHEWEARPQHILKGHWCPRCGKPFKRSLNDMQAYARSRGGKCTSIAYAGSERPLEWQCGNGHKWSGTPANVVSRRTWCPRCAGFRTTLGDLRRAARKFGGACLSKRYLCNDHNHLWQCREGHRFVKTWDSVKRGSWCFDCMFYEKWHRWPRNSHAASEREIARETGVLGVETLKIVARRSDLAVDPGRGHRLRKSIGEVKALADARGGKLLSTSYNGAHEPLQWQCREGHTFTMRAAMVVTGAWCPLCAGNKRLSIEELGVLARTHGGELVSRRYDGNKAPLKWRCRNGHVFRMRVTRVGAGDWCNRCRIDAESGGLERCRSDAASHGGKCLSTTYLNTYTDLAWRCAKGHRWRAPAARIRQGKWCPRCGPERLGAAISATRARQPQRWRLAGRRRRA